MVDFIQNYLIIGGHRYNLDEARAYLLANHPTLCANNFVKMIMVKGEPLFTYDWMTIFEIAEIGGITGYLGAFHREKIKECNTLNG